MEITDVLEKVDEKIIFKKPYGLVKIPEAYFDKKLALFLADDESSDYVKLQTFGIFKLYVYNDYNTDDLENNKPEIFSFKIPSSIILTPKNIEEVVEDGERICLCEFVQESTFIQSTKIIQQVSNVTAAFNLLFNNYIPDDMSYTDILDLLLDSALLNSINLKADAVNIETMIMNLVRDPNNLTEPLRMTFAKNPNHDPKKFKIVRLLDAAKYSDAFSALTSANPMLGIINSVKDKKEGRIPKDSPVEESIK